MNAPETNNSSAPLSGERLLDAADAILRVQGAGGEGGIYTTGSAPKEHAVYSTGELVEAMAFLRRLGLIAPQQSGGQGRRRP